MTSFAEHGYEASMEDIAVRRRRRRRDAVSPLPQQGRSSRRRGGGSPGAQTPDRGRRSSSDVAAEEGVFEFVRRCIAVPSCWRATISAPPWRTTGTGPRTDGSSARGDPRSAASRAGLVRSDIEVADVVVLLLAVRSIADVCDTKSSKPSLRFLELGLDGLRPGHQAPVHDPLTIAQLDRILRGR